MAGLPLSLRAALAKARLFHGQTAIRPLRVEEILHSHSQQPVSHEAVRQLIRDWHSIVWLSGNESGDPLTHPGIGHLARLIVSSGHTLFLETDGIALRQRIHEFQPASRLFLVVRLFGSESEHDRHMQRSGAFAAAIEGIRAARLSGFWICAKLDVLSGDPAESARLFQQIEGLDLDGIISATEGGSRAHAPWNRILQLVATAKPASAPRSPVQVKIAGAAATVESDCEEVTQV
jgi:hypothetical protein